MEREMIKRVDAYAALVGAVLIAGWMAYYSGVKEAAPATDFFVVNTLSIPDFVEGTDPVMVYDRTIKKDFLGTFMVEIRATTATANYTVCSNSGSRSYTVGKKLPETITLKWFVDRDCGLLAGQYVAETTWKIEAQGYPMKEYSAVSNVFRVIPKGGQLYIKPEQVEQLKKSQEIFDDPIPIIPQ